MKRYDMFNDYDGTKDGITPKEAPKGRWVEWEDAKKQIVYFGGIPLIGDDVGGGFVVKNKNIKFEYGRCVSATVEMYQKFTGGDTTIPISSNECTCGEMLRNGRNWWICPAHGYKKR